MSRGLAVAVLICAVGALGWAGLRLTGSAQPSAYTLPMPDIVDAAPPDRSTQDVARPFLAIYGSAETPAEVVVERPSQGATFAYSLKGVIAVGQMRWAVLSHSGGDVIVREGEILEGGAEVLRVRAEGIDLLIDGTDMALGFDAEVPVTLAEIDSDELVTEVLPPRGNFAADTRTAVLYQDMTPDEILSALQEAERRRAERGWITVSE